MADENEVLLLSGLEAIGTVLAGAYALRTLYFAR
jgi:hypothetical protein